ncbi:MAG: Dabb family protein [Geminicoccales bacterium]
MHSHTVFFWLWKTISDHERAQFERGLAALTLDPNILDRRIGKPAATDRSVIDTSYDYGMVLRFETLAAHGAYQVGQPHQQFLETCAHMWSRVQVYDIDELSLNE